MEWDSEYSGIFLKANTTATSLCRAACKVLAHIIHGVDFTRRQANHYRKLDSIICIVHSAGSGKLIKFLRE